MHDNTIQANCGFLHDTDKIKTTIFELAIPRDEVLQGELSEDLFAARLKDVMDGTAAPVYQDAGLFFSNTYLTAGLRTLLREVLGRLTEQMPGNNPIIRLETSFGDGKTHNLIALYHAASGAANARRLQGYLDDDGSLLHAGQVLVAGVVGSDLDPTIGLLHEEDMSEPSHYGASWLISWGARGTLWRRKATNKRSCPAPTAHRPASWDHLAHADSQSSNTVACRSGIITAHC